MSLNWKQGNGERIARKLILKNALIAAGVTCIARLGVSGKKMIITSLISNFVKDAGSAQAYAP
jgi:uncharacterized protein involved in tellurium resistance